MLFLIKRHNWPGAVEHKKEAGRPAKLCQSVKYICAKDVNSDYKSQLEKYRVISRPKHDISVP